MRRFEPPASRFTVQMGPLAWRQVSRLPADTYRRVREALDAIAAAVASSPVPTRVTLKDGDAPSGFSLVVGEYVVVYDVDAARRSVTLLEVALRLPRKA